LAPGSNRNASSHLGIFSSTADPSNVTLAESTEELKMVLDSSYTQGFSSFQEKATAQETIYIAVNGSLQILISNVQCSLNFQEYDIPAQLIVF